MNRRETTVSLCHCLYLLASVVNMAKLEDHGFRGKTQMTKARVVFLAMALSGLSGCMTLSQFIETKILPAVEAVEEAAAEEKPPVFPEAQTTMQCQVAFDKATYQALYAPDLSRYTGVPISLAEDFKRSLGITGAPTPPMLISCLERVGTSPDRIRSILASMDAARVGLEAVRRSPPRDPLCRTASAGLVRGNRYCVGR